MKIIDLRNTQSQGWVADVLLNPDSILAVSIPVLDCDPYELMEYANTDPEHISKPIRLGNVIFDIQAIGENIKSYSATLKTMIDARMKLAQCRAKEYFGR